MPEGSPRAHCLWGNPAIACAYLLARPFGEGGWGLAGGASGEIDDLPFYVYREGGESEMMPCAEAWLDDRAAGALCRKGLIPVRSVRGRSAIRIEQCQSLAGPGKPLAGWWRR
jgi:predicted component of type VI protein secretion system